MPTQPYYYEKNRVPSVTTILSRFKESGALIYWAYNQGIKHGEMPTSERPASLYSETEALDIGTLAHRMVELYLSDINTDMAFDELMPTPEVKEAGTLAFNNFLNWWKSQDFEIIQQEFPMTCPLYGGTPDAIAVNKDGKYVILDWKTSKGIYADYLVQCAAYAHLWNQRLSADQLHQNIDEVHICRFSKENTDFEHRAFTGVGKEIDYFLRLAELYQVDKDISKRIR